MSARDEHRRRELLSAGGVLFGPDDVSLGPEVVVAEHEGGFEAVSGADQDGEVCASALWRELDRPVLGDAAGKTWVLGESASDRQSKLESLLAPDFTLPDIEGKLHSLSDYRGKKVLLATWASW